MSFFPSSMIWPRRVLSGEGCLESLAYETLSLGARGVLVHGRSLGRTERLGRIVAGFAQPHKFGLYEHSGGEPTLEQVEALRHTIRQREAEWVAAIGGGSVLDLAKAGAALAAEPGKVREYHRGEPIRASCLPILAAPAVSGSGSEATGVSVLIDPESRTKKAIRSPGMFPETVFLDPSLPAGCPARVVAHSGLDGLAQAVESFVSLGATPFTEALSARGIELFASSLQDAVERSDAEAFGRLQAASLLTAMAFSVSRLGVIHGLVHPLGARFGLPHGQLCGVCLPLALEFNREAVPEKYGEIEAIMGQDPIRFVQGLLDRLDMVNPLLGQPLSDPEAVAAETLESGSTAHNPRPVGQADVRWFLKALLGSGHGS